MFHLPSIVSPPSRTQSQEPHPWKTLRDAAPEFRFSKNLCATRPRGRTPSVWLGAAGFRFGARGGLSGAWHGRKLCFEDQDLFVDLLVGQSTVEASGCLLDGR